MTIMRMFFRIAALFAAVFALPAHAGEMRHGGKLVLTNGITSVEGASGGGLTPWATIAGNATRDGIGIQASATVAEVRDYDYRNLSVAIGAFDRVELSYARQTFDTNKVGGMLGLGNDFKFDQDVFGAKVKLAGDLVFGKPSLPAIAVGVQYKRSLDAPVVAAVGAKHRAGVDVYATASKLLLSHSVLASTTIRATKANQMGLLGFGGDKSNKYGVHLEGTIAYQLSRTVAVGAEYRSKPNKLGIAREDDWFDVFAAIAITRNITATAAYTDLGSVATRPKQRGMLFQIQTSF